MSFLIYLNFRYHAQRTTLSKRNSENVCIKNHVQSAAKKNAMANTATDAFEDDPSLQVGRFSLHSPLLFDVTHVVVLDPFNLSPDSQLKSHVLLILFPSVHDMLPFFGASRVRQVITEEPFGLAGGSFLVASFGAIVSLPEPDLSEFSVVSGSTD